MNRDIIQGILNRFKARQFLFKTMHLHEVYLAFKSDNILDIVIKMEEGHELEKKGETLAVFFASTLGFQYDFTFYIIEFETYKEKDQLINIL